LAAALVCVYPSRGLMAVQGAFVACDGGVAVDAGLRGAAALNGLLSQQGMFAVSMRGTGNAVVHGASDCTSLLAHIETVRSPLTAHPSPPTTHHSLTHPGVWQASGA